MKSWLQIRYENNKWKANAKDLSMYKSISDEHQVIMSKFELHKQNAYHKLMQTT